jgi:hypothetical protein
LGLGLVIGIELINLLRHREGLIMSFFVIEVFVILALMGGLVAVNLIRPPRLDRVRTLIAATGAAALLAAPLILYLKGDEGFAAGIRLLFDTLVDFMARSFAQPEAATTAVVPVAADTETLMRITSSVFLRSFAFSYFLFTCFTRRWLVLLLLSLGIMLIFTRLSLLVIILIPGLGISEIWLHYRKQERSESSQ